VQISCRRRGFALITVLGIIGLLLLVCLVILIMTEQNSQNVGNAYQKQHLYDVAEAGIDRGLRDLDTNVPPPGSIATPGPIPSPPTADQTPLPNTPNVPYHYSYWYNAGPAVATPDPLAGSFGVSSGHQVQIPAFGALIWSYTKTGSRDVAVETIVSRFSSSDKNCAICAGNNISALGSQNFTAPTSPAACGSTKNPYKICSDPNASPSPMPTNVPIIAGGTYTCSGAVAKAAPCALGDGTSTPSPTLINQNASSGVTSGFLASQGTIDQLSNAGAWYALSLTSGNIKYKDCPSGCDTSALATVAPNAGQVLFVNGNITLSSKSVLSYGGLIIVSGCLTISQPGMAGSGTGAETVVLGTDTQCNGVAVTMQGGGNTQPPLWNGGTLYAAQGSVSVSGNGSVRGYNFYGAIIAFGNVTVTGNGFFAWESGLRNSSLTLGPFAIDSFAQY